MIILHNTIHLRAEAAELSCYKNRKKYNVSDETIKRYMDKFNIPYNKKPICTNDEDFFTRENEATFYVAGFLAADGCVSIEKGSYRLSLLLGQKDIDHLYLLRNLMKADNKISKRTSKNPHPDNKWNDSLVCNFKINSKKYFDDLSKFNIVPRKSLILEFPEWLIEHPLANHFMRGYNDGDGSWSVANNQIKFHLRGTKNFLLTFRNILERECSNIKKRTTEISIHDGCGQLSYGGNIIAKSISNFLYKDATIFLPRKREIIKHLLNDENNLNMENKI